MSSIKCINLIDKRGILPRSRYRPRRTQPKTRPMNKIDVHQHFWTASLLEALAARHELPLLRREHQLLVLHLAGERPYVIDTSGETLARRAALLRRDELAEAFLCISSPLGIESLAREQATPLLDAYHDGALALGPPFAVWGAIALDCPRPDDVDRLLDRGCIGISLPAGALAGADALACLRPVLARLQSRGAALFVHPGPGRDRELSPSTPSLADPLWWPALTRYVAQMQAAWLTLAGVARTDYPDLRVVFAMLAGLAPLHAERLRARGGPTPRLADPLLFYDTSSYGPSAVRAVAAAVGPQQLLYGSDRPVIDPDELGMPERLDWEAIADATERAFPSARGHQSHEPSLQLVAR
jgi:6-methylsalicylate decarboxylase